MPSPGVADLKSALAAETFLVGAATVSFDADGEMITKLATAIDAGWTSSYPSTPTTMAAAFAAELAGYASGDGLAFLNSIASAIDADVALWVASYVAVTGLHSYVVNATAITAATLSSSPVSSPGVIALATAAGNAFAAEFVQEEG